MNKSQVRWINSKKEEDKVKYTTRPTIFKINKGKYEIYEKIIGFHEFFFFCYKVNLGSFKKYNKIAQYLHGIEQFKKT